MSRERRFTRSLMRRMSAGESIVSPSTELAIGWQKPCDIGAIQLAIEGSGAASASPQPTLPPAWMRTSSASWLPSLMSSTTGMET